eukprot:1194325-Prorocentrum_minimum.AAC.1
MMTGPFQRVVLSPLQRLVPATADLHPQPSPASDSAPAADWPPSLAAELGQSTGDKRQPTEWGATSGFQAEFPKVNRLVSKSERRARLTRSFRTGTVAKKE